MKKNSLFVVSAASLFLVSSFFNTSFVQAQSAPPTPTITQPANGLTVSSPVTVAWSGAVPPYIYTLWRNGAAVSGCVDLSYTSVQCADNGASGSATYNVVACTGLNNGTPCAGSNSVSVTVGTSSPPPPPPTPPAVPNAPYLYAPYASGISVNLSWNTQSSTSWYNISRRTPPGISNTWTAVANTITTVFYTDWSVGADTSYEYRVNACNSTGCSGDSNYQSITLPSNTSSTSDTQPPTVPTGVFANASTSTSPIQVLVYWNFSTDNVGVAGYKIYRNGNLYVSVANNNGYYADTAVSAGITYSYAVAAYDAAGNVSSQSNLVYVTIAPSGGEYDTTPPSMPTGLVVTKDVSNEVDLSWSASTDNVGVVGYYVWKSVNAAWSQFGQLATPPYIDYAVAPSMSYYYAVVAYDAAGNRSATSTNLFLTTPAAPITNTSTTSSVSGVCMLRNGLTSTPGFFASNVGSGYAKLAKPGVNDITTLRGFCTTSDYDYLLQQYCTQNASTVGNYGPQQQVVTYNADGSVNSSGCGPDGQNCVSRSSCPTTTTPSPTPTPTPAPAPTSTAQSAPATPSGLTYNLSNSGTVINLIWTDNSTNETRFEIYRQPQSGTWLYYTQVGAGVTSYSDTNVPAGGYYYQVAACNGASTNIGCSYGSNIIFAATSDTASSTATVQSVPNAPSNLLAISGKDVSGANNAYLNWTDNSNNELGFKLYRNANGGGWTDIGNVGAGVTSYADMNLSLGSYVYHLNAFALSNGSYVYSGLTNDAAVTIYTTTAAFSTTITPPPVPTYVNQPYGLTTYVPSGSANVSLTWINNSSAATSINIGRRPSGAPAWTIVGSAGGSATSYTDVSVPPGNYDYEVFACNTAGCPQTGSNWMLAAVGSALYVDLRADGMKGIVYRSAPASYTLTWNTSGAYGSGCAASGNWGDNVSKSIPSGSQYFTGVTVAATDANPKVYTLTCFNAKGESVSDTVKVQITSAGVFSTSTTSVTGAFVKGTVTDASGVSVPGVYIHVFTDGFSLNFSAFTDTNGAFGINLPAGTYLLEISPPSSRSDLIKPAPAQISVSEGNVKTVTLQFSAGTKTIAGAASFSNGQPVTDAEVGAYSSDTHQWVSMFINQGGKYSLRVSGGTWQVGIRPLDQVSAKWSWTGAFPIVTFRADGTTEVQMVNFTVPVSDAWLTVHATDESGNPLQAGVVVDIVSASQPPPEGTNIAPPIFQKSDATGYTNFTLKAGTYYLRAFLPPEFGYYNPDEQVLSLASGQSQDIKLVFRKRSTASTAAVRGTTKLDDGTLAAAFIWAWSEKGESTQLHSDDKGAFGFPAVAGRWHIGAGKEVNGYPYKSSELTVDVAEGDSANVEIVLSSLGKNPLAPPVTVSQPSTQQIIVQSQDGAKVTMPDGASAGTGNISLQVKPTIEAPSQGGAKVVSTVYDINLHDASGTSVTSLQKKIEIQIPYDPDELKNQGISPDRIVPSYYDESTGTWVKADDYTIDKDKHVAIVRIQHLTRFAIIAAADITPPDAPTGISAVKSVSGVAISWKNPATDFDHVKVYRSLVKGNLGKLILNNLTNTQASDSDVVTGTRYYYTVRAVDPAGNESTNLEQATLVASGGSTSGKLSRKLSFGSRGDDVKTLQALLIKEGVFPDGIVSGYFRNLTKAAVIRFQEKYADEILKPAGLTQGTGFVGNGTRAKLNQFLK